ncbi:MAG: PTS system mannose/fructose/sorbose family transporter subunit IID [Erysipelotrichaceae bacterium]|nr:PTS system mannose/fructose/sorbose family transporter subunit IID [Erysipelotrichaceae bacterium]
MAETLEQKSARLDALVDNPKWLNKVMYIYFVGCTACFTMEMMMVHGMLDMFNLIAKDLYPDDKEKQTDLIQRHLNFYNTQPNMTIVPGTVLGMEIQRAKGEDVPNDAIQAVKAALAGSFAGIGDAIIQGMFTPVLTSICMGMSAGGSGIGAIALWVLWWAIMWPLDYVMFKAAIKGGASASDSILSAGNKERFISAITILGCIVVGAVTASTVRLNLAWHITTNGLDVAVQNYMDQIYPGLVSFIGLFVVYTVMTKKKIGALKMILILLAVAVLAYFIKMF